MDRFDSEILKAFDGYLVPTIILGKESPKDAVCQVFEKVNTGGVSLTVFELLTATYRRRRVRSPRGLEADAQRHGRKEPRAQGNRKHGLFANDHLARHVRNPPAME